MEQGIGYLHYDNPKEFEQKIKKDGVNYTCYPKDGYIWSRFYVGFTGCYGYTDKHLFSGDCTRWHQAGKDTFHFDLHCHKVGGWFWYTNSSGAGVDGGLPSIPGESSGRRSGWSIVTSSWMSLLKTNAYVSSARFTHISPGSNGYKCVASASADQYVSTIRLFNIKDGNIQRVHISSNNKLPQVAFPIIVSAGV